MDDEEPTILQYARQHGLAIDFVAIDAVALLPHFDNNETTLFDSDPPWASLSVTGLDLAEPEKLQVKKQVFDFLSSVLKVGTELPEARQRRLKGLKLEPPLLRTDPGLENFGRSVDFGIDEALKISPAGIQPAAPNRDLWQRIENAAQVCKEAVQSEELVMEKETKKYLEAVLMCPEFETIMNDIEKVIPECSLRPLRPSLHSKKGCASPLVLAHFDDLRPEDDINEILADETASPSEEHGKSSTDCT